MYIYKPTGQLFYTRKQLKTYLGGTYRFNNALKFKDIEIIPDSVITDEIESSKSTVAINGEIIIENENSIK